MTAPTPAPFEVIADFVLAPDLAVPEEALRFAATLLIDTLGVAAGAAALDVAGIARDFAVDFHAAGGADNAAPMLFDGRSVSLPGAAWAAATQIDNLDGHDGYNPTKGHIGCRGCARALCICRPAPGSDRARGTDCVGDVL